MVRDRSWTRGATAVSTQRASACAMKCHVGRGPCVRMIVPSASARSIRASVSPGARCASAHLARLVLLRLHRAEPGDDGGGIGRHRRGETLRAHPARDERIGRGRHQEWIFTRTRTSAGGSGSIVTKVGSPAKRRPRTATRDPAGCGPVNVPARRARLRGVHDDQELVADAGQLAGDDDLSAPRALAVRVHDDDRFVGVEDARPGDQLAGRRQREVAEHADGALVLASDAQHGVPGPRRAQRLDAPVGRTGRVEGVRVEGAERPEAGQRLVALEHLGVEVFAVRRSRVGRPEHRLAQVAIVPAPAMLDEELELARRRPGERLLGSVVDARDAEREQLDRRRRHDLPFLHRRGVGDLGREAQLAAEHVIVVVDDRDVAIAEGAVRLEALARLVERAEVVRRAGAGPWRRRSGSGGRRRCRGRP